MLLAPLHDSQRFCELTPCPSVLRNRCAGLFSLLSTLQRSVRKPDSVHGKRRVVHDSEAAEASLCWCAPRGPKRQVAEHPTEVVATIVVPPLADWARCNIRQESNMAPGSPACDWREIVDANRYLVRRRQMRGGGANAMHHKCASEMVVQVSVVKRRRASLLRSASAQPSDHSRFHLR